MGGTGGIPQNMQNYGFNVNSMQPAPGFGGNNWNQNNVSAVQGSDNKLQAFDPSTMASTYTPSTPTAPNYGNPADYSASGLPDYITNWLASGAKTPMPTSSSTGIKTEASTAAKLAAVPKRNVVIPKSQSQPAAVNPAPVAAPAAAAASGGGWLPMEGPEPATTLTPIQKQMLVNGQIKANTPELQNWLRWKVGGNAYVPGVANAINTNTIETQRAWEQYGGPTANIGSGGGVAPPGYSAHQWYGGFYG